MSSNTVTTSSDTIFTIITLFNRTDVDFRTICANIAANEPDMFLHYANAVAVTAAVPTVEQQVIDIIRNNGVHSKIANIKDTRALTGWGLKEAKDYVDNLYYKFDNNFQ